MGEKSIICRWEMRFSAILNSTGYVCVQHKIFEMQPHTSNNATVYAGLVGAV